MKTIDPDKKLYVTGAIDLPTLILTKYSETYRNNHQDKYAYFIHKIIEGQIFGNVKANGLTKLNAEKLQNIMGGDYYKPIIQDLLNWGVVITDNRFVRGKESKGYGIAPAYQAKAVEILILNEVFANKLKKKSIVTANKPSNYIQSQLKNIKIRHAEAIEYIEEKLKNTIFLINSISSEQLYQEFKEQVRIYDDMEFYTIKKEDEWDLTLLNDKTVLKGVMFNKYNVDYMAINHINDRKYCFSVDSNTGRVYTFITSISKPLRRFLFNKKYPNQSLVNIDIKNSQPFIFCSLLAEYYKGMYPPDVQDFFDLCSAGKLYDYLQDKSITGLTRDEIKVILFATVFYCKNHYTVRTEFGKFFISLFPTVFKVISHYKTTDHKHLSYLMQKAEADLMVQKVVKCLMRDSIFLTTIHDSIICLEADVKKVKSTIFYYFQKEYKLAPTLDEDYLTTVYSVSKAA